MNIPTGICTWSLNNDLSRIQQVLTNSGLTRLHADVSILKEALETGNTITATMVAFPQEDYSTLETIRVTGGLVPDDAWARNLDIAMDAIEQTANAGIPYLSTHAGFIDHNDTAGFREISKRIQQLADAAAARGITLLMETGQETAADLKQFLNALGHSHLGVNFDPANMILYGKGCPIEAVRILAPWIRHVHFKDAIATRVPGEWGEEVPWGEGEVNLPAFLQALADISYSGCAAIERESGDQREDELLQAAKKLEVLHV